MLACMHACLHVCLHVCVCIIGLVGHVRFKDLLRLVIAENLTHEMQQ
jgi:hypothetical protein